MSAARVVAICSINSVHAAYVPTSQTAFSCRPEDRLTSLRRRQPRLRRSPLAASGENRQPAASLKLRTNLLQGCGLGEQV